MPFVSSGTYSFQTTSWKEVPCVYGVMNAERQMIYVSETDNLKRRMDQHWADRAHCMHKYAPALVDTEAVTSGEVARRQRARTLIAEYNPLCNR